MAAYFQKNLRLLTRKYFKKRGTDYNLEILSLKCGIPKIKLELWFREGEPVLAEIKKIADFFTSELKHEILANDLINRDLTTDPYFYDII